MTTAMICDECDDCKAIVRCTLCDKHYCDDCKTDHLNECEYARDVFEDL